VSDEEPASKYLPLFRAAVAAVPLATLVILYVEGGGHGTATPLADPTWLATFVLLAAVGVFYAVSAIPGVERRIHMPE
jgi:hypothetical protein